MMVYLCVLWLMETEMLLEPCISSWEIWEQEAAAERHGSRICRAETMTAASKSRDTEGFGYQTRTLRTHLTRGCQQVNRCQEHPASTGFFTLVDLQELDDGPTCSLCKTKGTPINRGESLINLKIHKTYRGKGHFLSTHFIAVSLFCTLWKN